MHKAQLKIVKAQPPITKLMAKTGQGAQEAPSVIVSHACAGEEGEVVMYHGEVVEEEDGEVVEAEDGEVEDGVEAGVLAQVDMVVVALMAVKLVEEGVMVEEVVVTVNENDDLRQLR